MQGKFFLKKPESNDSGVVKGHINRYFRYVLLRFEIPHKNI